MKKRTGVLSCFILLGSLSISIFLRAQDTLRINLQDAEKQFLEKNLSLLAQKYNIDIARAQIIQAKLYNNPNFSGLIPIYNPQAKKYFDVSKETGEYAFGIQQLIILAGKRNKQVKLAETNATISEQQFYDVLRTLQYSLRSDFYDLFYTQNSLGVYDKEIPPLQKLDSTYHDLQAKGVVTAKDAVRIRSVLYSLRAEKAQLQTQENDLEAELRLLLQNNKSFIIPVSGDLSSINLSQFSLQALIDTAYNNRNDLKAAQSNVIYSQQNYALQKALRVPDLTLGASYDKAGSYVNNATFFSAAIDLPFFNRNQGNIKASKIEMDQNKTLLDLQTQTVENDVQRAYAKTLTADKMLQSIDPSFANDFEKLLQGVLENFERKNINLIEFTDFYDAYKNNVLQLNQLQNAKMQAIEALNFSVGKTLINP